MSRGAKIIFLVVIAVLVVATILILLLRAPRLGPAPEPEAVPVAGALPRAPASPGAQPSATTVPPTPSAGTPVAQATEAERARAEIIRVSIQFAERFGSYSSQSNFENIEDLKPIMTPTMQAWADQFVAEVRSSRTEDQAYIGVTTRAVTSRITDYSESEGTATVVVSTQREEATDPSAPRRVYYQDIEISLRKIGGAWLVDAAEWK